MFTHVHQKICETLLHYADPCITVAVLFQHCSNVRNCHGFSGFATWIGILHSKFVGLANFEYMFQMSDITQVLRNTVVIAVGKIIGNIIIPLVFALLLK